MSYIIPDYSGDNITTLDLQDVEGWDNTRKIVPDYRENNVFLGNPNITQNTLPFIEPFIGGYGRVFCLQAPIFFDYAIRGLLIRMIERFCRGLSGLSNYELQTVDITYGNNAETYTVPTNIKKGNTNFSLRFQELQGGLFRKIHKYWITGISDLNSGYGTYHGKVYTENLRWSPINHTAIMMYALSDNSGGAYGLDSLEFACLWYGVFPTTVNNTHFEWDQGTHDTIQLDISYNGVYQENNVINELAADMLAKSNFYRDNYNMMDLGPSVNQAYYDRINSADDSDLGVPGFEPIQPEATQYTNLDMQNGGSSPLFNSLEE